MTSKQDYYSKFSKPSFNCSSFNEFSPIHAGDSEIEFKKNLKDFRIPEDFSRQEILDSGLPLKFVPNAMIFLSLMRIICNHKKHFNKKEMVNPYARLNSRILKNYILTLSKESVKLIKFMEEKKWIEVDHSYRVGVESKGYRLGERFKDSEWKIQSWPEALKQFVPEVKIKSYISRKKDVLFSLWDRASSFFFTWEAMEEGLLKDICRRTSEILPLLSLINRELLEQTILDCATNGHIEYLTECKNKKKKPKWTEENRIENYRYAVAAIENGNFGILCHNDQHVDHTDRLFTNWTNLKKDFKKFFVLDNRPLVTVDVKACQPALLTSFYNESLEDQVEKKKYLNILIDLDIYEFLADGDMSRKAAKVEMFKVMFDRNSNQTTELCESFKNNFPILTQRIHDKKRFGYKKVAREMQLKESKIMVWGVLNALYFEHKITCLSVHDAISCFKEDVDIVKKVIVKYFLEEMDFIPVLNIE